MFPEPTTPTARCPGTGTAAAGPGVTFAYDDNDSPTGTTTTYTGLPAETIGYGYFPNGSRANMTTPAGSFPTITMRRGGWRR